MPRVTCEHVAQPGFIEELHKACVHGIADMVEKNGLCPVCVAVGFGSALGNMISKADHRHEERLAIVQEAIYNLFVGYNSVTPDLEISIRNIEISEVKRN